VARLESRRDILAAMADFLDQRKHALVTLSLDPRIIDTLPFVWKNFKVVPRYTYILDLTVSLEDLKRNMSSTRRNDISKAARDGLVVRQTTDPAIVRSLVQDTLARQHVHSNTKDLDAILFRFASENNSYAFTTYQDEMAIACCFIIHDARTAYYLLGGTCSNGKHHGGGALALSEAIAHAKKIGLSAFDFEGSMIPAIEKYVRGFGGQLTPYFSVNKAWYPLEMALKAPKRRLF
jgi:lipid II:glycine glycyltransferase (peptidoglycan interpeptide bridge formation enzyme)